MDRPHIVHITTDAKKGGAAIAANRLNEAFNKNGIVSKLLVFTSNYIKDDILFSHEGFVKSLLKVKVNILAYLQKYIFRPSYAFTTGFFGCNLSKIEAVKTADVIFIHWVGDNFLSIRSIEKILKLNKPTILYMHDMWFITGGCHHSFDCMKYKKKCINCPIIKNTILKSIPTIIFDLKNKLLTNYDNLHIVTPSNWLGNCVKESAIFKDSNICVIPNLIDTDIFKPLNKDLARTILNLPLNKKLILFGASMGKSDKYKGWDLLIKSIDLINREDIAIVLFGGYLSQAEEKSFKVPIYSMGYLYDQYSTVLLYNAVDVFVTPSLAENFPNVLLEAISCGTYTVGFNIGGIPDLIHHKKTGYLAEYKDIEDFANGIIWTLDNIVQKEELHSFVNDNFSYKTLIAKYDKLINL